MLGKRIMMFVAAGILVPIVLCDFKNAEEIESNIINEDRSLPFAFNKVDNIAKHIIDAYERNLGSQLSTDFNTARDQVKYQVLKRNSDIINTLLGFPRRMLQAGR